jgi:hypothetical protein
MDSTKILLLTVAVFLISLYMVKTHKEGFELSGSQYIDSVLAKYVDQTFQSYNDMMKSNYQTADCYALRTSNGGWAISDGCKAGAVSSLLESQVANAAFRQGLNQQTNDQLLSVPEKQKGSYPTPSM